MCQPFHLFRNKTLNKKNPQRRINMRNKNVFRSNHLGKPIVCSLFLSCRYQLPPYRMANLFISFYLFAIYYYILSTISFFFFSIFVLFIFSFPIFPSRNYCFSLCSFHAIFSHIQYFLLTLIDDQYQSNARALIHIEQ